MAKNTQLSLTVINSQASDIAARCNNAIISLYDGTQPITADTAIVAQVKGVDLTMSATAFGNPVNGVVTANTITSGVAVAGITPTWARISANGITIMDVSVGTTNSNIIQAAFVLGDTVTITSFTHTVLLSVSGL